MHSEASIHVLHVDDEPEFAELTSEFLKRENDDFTVTTATSASEGVEYLSRGDFDCIVSDYDMPTQNDIDFLKSVREMFPDLPFVLFTGKGSEEIAGEAISAGVTDYLQKKRGTDQYTVLANRLRNAVQRTVQKESASGSVKPLKRPKKVLAFSMRTESIFTSIRPTLISMNTSPKR